MNSPVRLFVFLLVSCSATRGQPDEPNSGDQSENDLSPVTSHQDIVDRLEVLFEPDGGSQIDFNHYNSYERICQQIGDVLSLSDEHQLNIDPQSETRIQILRNIEGLTHQQSCDQSNLDHRDMISNDYQLYPRLRFYIEHNNKQVYELCAHQLEEEMLDRIQFLRASSDNILALREYVRNEMPLQRRPRLFINLELRELGRGIMQYSSRVDGNQWNQGPNETIQYLINEFELYIIFEFGDLCSQIDEYLLSYLNRYLWLYDHHNDNLDSTTSPQSKRWFDCIKICDTLSNMEKFSDIVMDSKFDFFAVSDQVFLVEGEPVMSVPETRDSISKLDLLVGMRQRFYSEQHPEIEEYLRIFEKMLSARGINCNVRYIHAFNEILNEFKDYVNLGPLLKEAGRQQQLACVGSISREVNTYSLTISSWDSMQITSLRERILNVQPIISQLQYITSISLSRFLNGLFDYLRDLNIIIDPHNLDPSVRVAIDYIAEPCQRLRSNLGDTHALFEELILLHPGYHIALRLFDITWMNNTKICLALLTYPLSA